MHGSQKIQVISFDGLNQRSRADVVVQEEPLELRLEMAGTRQTVYTTMRTAGHDFELALGWCLSEGIISKLEDVAKVSYCLPKKLEQRFNIVNLKLRNGLIVAVDKRHTLSTSACGVCGKANLEALEMHCQPIQSQVQIAPDTLYALPDKLRAAQTIFESTGGIHAAGLFSSQGDLLALREDVGRHNAVDKLIGWAIMQPQNLEQTILLVSGRVGFEIAQKAIQAQIPVLASVSAPSSLAIDVAKHFDLTLIGFLRGQKMNLYAGAKRIGGTAT